MDRRGQRVRGRCARSKWREKIAGEKRAGSRGRGAPGAFIAYGSAKHLWNNGPAKYIVGEEKRKYLARKNRKMGFYCAATRNAGAKYFTGWFCFWLDPCLRYNATFQQDLRFPWFISKGRFYLETLVRLFKNILWLEFCFSV